MLIVMSHDFGNRLTSYRPLLCQKWHVDVVAIVVAVDLCVDILCMLSILCHHCLSLFILNGARHDI